LRFSAVPENFAHLVLAGPNGRKGQRAKQKPLGSLAFEWEDYGLFKAQNFVIGNFCFAFEFPELG
jgi:hypothetical protein